MAPPNARRPPALVLALIAILVAGCGSTVGSLAPTASPAPTRSEQPVASSAIASASPAIASPLASTVLPTATMDDPDLVMTLPVGWYVVSVATFRTQVQTMMAQATGPTREVMQAGLADIDSGAVRLVSAGPTGFVVWTGSLFIQVNPRDPSLDAAVARVVKRSAIVVQPTNVEQHQVSLAIGVGIRHTEILGVPEDVEGGVASHVIDYLVQLPDGRTLWVSATGPRDATGFDALIDPAVLSLHSR